MNQTIQIPPPTQTPQKFPKSNVKPTKFLHPLAIKSFDAEAKSQNRVETERTEESRKSGIWRGRDRWRSGGVLIIGDQASMAEPRDDDGRFWTFPHVTGVTHPLLRRVFVLGVPLTPSTRLSVKEKSGALTHPRGPTMPPSTLSNQRKGKGWVCFVRVLKVFTGQQNSVPR